MPTAADIEKRLDALRGSVQPIENNFQAASAAPPNAPLGSIQSPDQSIAAELKVRNQALDGLRRLQSVIQSPNISQIGPEPGTSADKLKASEKGQSEVEERKQVQLEKEQGMLDRLKGTANAFLRGLVRGPASLVDILTLGHTKSEEALDSSRLELDGEKIRLKPDPMTLLYKATTGKEATQGDAAELLGTLASEMATIFAPINKVLHVSGLPKKGAALLSKGKASPLIESAISDSLTGAIYGSKDGWQSALMDAALFPAIGVPARLIMKAGASILKMDHVRKSQGKYSYDTGDSNKVLNLFNNQNSEQSNTALQGSIDKLNEVMFDRTQPLAWMNKLYFSKTGQPLPIEKNPQIQARMWNGVINQTIQWLDKKAKPILQQIGVDDLKDFQVYAASKDAIDRIAHNPEWAASLGKHGVTKNTFSKTINDIESFWGPEKTQKMTGLHKAFTLANNDLVDMMVEAGVEKPESAIRMKLAHDYYVPFKRSEAAMDTYLKYAEKFSPGKTAPFKPIKGSLPENGYEWPVDAFLERGPKLIRMARQNELTKQVAKFPMLMPETYNGIIRPVNKGNLFRMMIGGEEGLAGDTPDLSLGRRALHYKSFDKFEKFVTKENGTFTSEELKTIWDKVQAFKDAVKKPIPNDSVILPAWFHGKQVDFYMPKETGEFLLGTNQAQLDFVQKMLKANNEIFKASVTSFNPVFTATNSARDFLTQLMVADNPIGPYGWMKGLYRAVKGDLIGDQLFDAAKAAGVGTGLNTSSKDIHKLARLSRVTEQGISPEAKLLAESGTLKNIGKKALNPKTYLEFVEMVNSWVEMAPRLGIAERNLRQGKSAAEAFWDAKNATLDFSKGGQISKLINMYVPFFNARLLGTEAMMKAFKKNPGRAAAVTVSSAILPEIAAYYWNTRRHPKHADEVSRRMEDFSGTLIIGEEKNKETGKMEPVIVKFPKSDVQRIFGQITNEFMRYLDDRDPEAVNQIGMRLMDQVSPVSFVDESGRFSGGRLLSSVSPPAVTAGFGASTGVDPSTGKSIVPPEFTYQRGGDESLKYDPKRVGKNAIILGDIFNTNPHVIDYLARTAFGLAGDVAVAPEKLGERLKDRLITNKANQLTFNALEAAKKVQGVFIDEKNKKSIQSRMMLDSLQHLSEDGTITPADHMKLIKGLAEQDPQLAKQMKEDLYKQHTESYVKILSQGSIKDGKRAAMIYFFLKKIPDRNKEKRTELLQTLLKAKTDDGTPLMPPLVKRQLVLMKQMDSEDKFNKEGE